MTTEAGRRLAEMVNGSSSLSYLFMAEATSAIAAIEAEARAAALAEVLALPFDRVLGATVVSRAAVLALADAPAPSEPGLVAAKVSADAEALMTAASGYHNDWWNHDQQNGHTSPEWLACDAWPCSALNAALLDAPAPSESEACANVTHHETLAHPAPSEPSPEPEGLPSDLPERVIVDTHGHYWRDFGTHLSMPPVSDENTPTEVRAVYDRPESRAEAWENGYVTAASAEPEGLDVETLATALVSSGVLDEAVQAASYIYARRLAAEYARLRGEQR